MANFELERGYVLQLDENNLSITEDFVVLKDGFPVGTLKNNLTWFKQSKTPEISDIKQIVYLGEYTWGYREFNSKLSEFELLKESDKERILEDFLAQKEFSDYYGNED